jgi:hypothetical protein
MHALVSGWFSFPHMGTTAGDLIVKDLVCDWLDEAGVSYDVAVDTSFKHDGAVNWEEVEVSKYTDLIFVCGPFGNGGLARDLMDRFSHARLTGVNLSLLDSLENWNPFMLLYERDSSRASSPDISFYAPPSKVPVVGVILVHKQKEYGDRALHEIANAAIERLTQRWEMSVVHIDTALENNKGGLRTPGEVEALIAKMDVVITTRLHGTVLSLKNGIPVIAIDPISGGAKITRQVSTFGWPLMFGVDKLDDGVLDEAFNFCLTGEAKQKASECAQKAIAKIETVKKDFIEQFATLQKTALSLR